MHSKVYMCWISLYEKYTAGTCVVYAQGTVYMYYGLTNFYQNHRRYVRSRDDNQLHGYMLSPGDLNDDCDPYKQGSSNGSSFGYAPCGAIANSLFNGKARSFATHNACTK